MLLRSVTKHVRAQNWTAVFLDLLIVVVGVFIGIQVSNWNEARLDRNLEQAIKGRLHEDFSDIRERLEQSAVWYEEGLASADWLFKIVASGQPPSGEEEVSQFKSALQQATASRLPAWPSATFVELQASGEIEILRSAQLKSALFEYDQMTQIAKAGFWKLSDRSDRFSAPIFESVILQPRIDAAQGTSSYVVASFDFERMVQDSKFLPYLSVQVSGHANNRVLQMQQLTAAQNVLALLESELSNEIH